MDQLCLFRRFTATLAFAVLAVSGFSQGFTVTGTVSDDKGSPLPSVTVRVKNSDVGVFSEVDGTYRIDVANANDVLVFSYIGYQTLEEAVNGRRNINATLRESASLLNEVVVVGYGTQEKEDVTGAISSIDGGALRNLPVAGASQAIQGRAAGVEVVRNGGAPGSGGSIRIRGTGTVNNADPLIVVDGVPLTYGNLNNINPNDIASIEVLKDASSSAIYGQRAANGVVIVTTKKGGFNQKTNVTLNTYWGSASIPSRIDVLDAPTLAQVKKEAYNNDGLTVPDIWNEPAFQTQRTNWQDELFRSGSTQNYDFTISGGSERSRYSFTGGYFNENGTIKTSYYDRYYSRLNAEFKVNDWLSIGENLQITRQQGNFVNTSSAQTGLVWSAIRFHPGLPVIAEQALPGHEVGDYGSSEISGEFGDINNPIFTTDIEDDKERFDQVLGNVYAEIKLLDGLKFRTNFALDASFFNRAEFSPIIDQQIRKNSRNSLGINSNENYALLSEYFLTYDKTFAEKHTVNLVGGYTAQDNSSQFLYAEKRDFPNEDPDQRFMNTGRSLSNISGGKSEFSLLSAFARANYSYDDRYLLTATIRRDGSSRFAPENRWGNFPAFSAGWRISREPFFQNVSGISFLKLTAGWGLLGNQNIPDYQYYALINSGRRYSFGLDGSTQITGASLGRYPNENVTWEKAQMTNVGLELGLLDNKLFGTFNYFIKDTKDMLLSPPTVGSAGRTSVPNQNVGELRNQGLEIELSYRQKVGEISYQISGNAAFIQTEVTKLYNGNFLGSQFYGRPNQEIARTYEGETIGTFYGWRTDGLYQSQGEIDSDPNLSNDPRRSQGLIQPGDVRFVDLDGNGLIDGNDRTIIGNPTPKMTYGLNANLGYKGFALNLFFLGVQGVDIYNADRMQGLDASYPFNMYQEMENRWTGAGTSNSIPRATVNRSNLNHRTSDLFIEDGSFLRLKNVSLSYTIPQSVTERLKMSNLTVYVTGQNVFTLTGYSGLDPELGYINDNLQRNVDYAQYPQARSWVFGLTAGF